MNALPDTFHSKTMPSTCTVWVGATNSKGYGLLSVDGTATLAHRLAYEAIHGPIPDGMTIDHLCRVRNCVTPAHLELVTIAENNRRGRAASSLRVGDTCTNGHRIHAGDLYVRPSGLTECRTCRGAGDQRKRIGRPTTQRRAERVASDINRADATTP